MVPDIYEISEIARKLTAPEKAILKQLREDGRGNYHRSTVAARKSLHRKGLADSPMSMGFGGVMISCVQHPTALGVEVQHYLGGAS